MTDLTLETLRAELAPIREQLAFVHRAVEALQQDISKIEAYANGVPVIGEAIAVLQRDVRLMRAAINDMGRTNITAGEVEAMHSDIDRALAQIRELSARLAVLEGR